MKSFFLKIKNKLIPKPHECSFQCCNYNTHFNRPQELKLAFLNPTWNHYPNSDVIKKWIDLGFDYAVSFQSHWKCECGRKALDFFLHGPFNMGTGKLMEEELIDASGNHLITEEEFLDMSKHPPVFLDVIDVDLERKIIEYIKQNQTMDIKILVSIINRKFKVNKNEEDIFKMCYFF